MLEKILALDPCDEAIEWLKDYDDLETAWNECERGDWLLWLVARLKMNHRKITLAKAQCAKLVLHLMEDERSIKAVEVAEAYGLGKATLDELNKAADDAYTVTVYAYADAYATYAAHTAHAAAYAANAHTYAACAAAHAAAADTYATTYTAAADTYADTYATAVTAYVTTYAADAAAKTASKVTKKATLKQCAVECRQVFTFEEVKQCLST